MRVERCFSAMAAGLAEWRMGHNQQTHDTNRSNPLDAPASHPYRYREGVMGHLLQFIGLVIVGLFGVVSASVLLDRLFNGARYVREARERKQRK